MKKDENDKKKEGEMMDSYHKDELEIHICPICEAQMEYDGMGYYVCQTCGVQDLDDYAKVREYLYEHGMAQLEEISAATEVPVERIQEFIDEGRFELVMHCAGCGVEIKRGMYCAECKRKTFMGLSDAMKNPEEKKGGHSKMYNSYTSKTGHHTYLKVKN